LEEQASARVVAARADVARMEEEVKEWQKVREGGREGPDDNTLDLS